MTHQESAELFEVFRTRAKATPVLADLPDAYLHAITVARPTEMADQLRVIAKDFVPLRTNQVHPLWLLWRQVLREFDARPTPASATSLPPVRTPSTPPAPANPAATPPADSRHVQLLNHASALLRARAKDNIQLKDLSDDYLHAIAVARPTEMADQLRVIAKDFVPLRTNQVHPLWLLWRQVLREVEESPVPAPAPTPGPRSAPPTAEPTPAAAPRAAAPPPAEPERTEPPAPAPTSAWTPPPVTPPAVAGLDLPDVEPAPPTPPAPDTLAAAATRTAPAPPTAPPTASSDENGFPSQPWADPHRDEFNPDIDVERPGVPLSAVVHRGRVRLQWPAVAAEAGERTVYLVVGGRSSVRGPLQGEALELTTQLSAAVDADRGPYFAVYAYRGRTLVEAVAARAVRVGTGIAIGDVVDLQTQVDPGAIRMQWTRPETATEVRVYKNEGAPVPDDYLMPYKVGIDPGADVVTDLAVTPGTRYFFLVVAVNADGFPSPGLTVDLTIPVRPKAVEDLAVDTRIEGELTVVDLSWSPPPDGATVQIYARSEPLPANIRRDELTVAELQALDLGQRALGIPVAHGERVVLDRAPFPDTQTQQFYTPVTVAGGKAVIGRSVSAARVLAVRNVEIVDRVDWQLVRFDWPAGASYVDLAMAHTGGEPLWSSRKRVLPDRYERDGGALFGVHESFPFHEQDVVLRGVSVFGGIVTPGPEARVHYGGRWPLAYRFVREGKAPTTLVVRSQHGDTAFTSPSVRIRVFHHPELMPLAPDQPGVNPVPIRREGVAHRVIEVPPGVLPAGVVVPIGEVDLPGHGFVRVLVDPVNQEVPLVVIDPPAPELLTIGRRVVPRLRPDEFRCRQCLAVQPRHPQVFECVNRSCSARQDGQPSRFQVVTPPPPPVQGRRGAPPPPPPVETRGACPTCGTESDREICKMPSCLTVVRPDWFAFEPLPIAMAGAKTTGKSVFAYVALQQLETRVARDFGASVTEYDNDTAARVETLRALFRGDGVPVSTQGDSGYEPFAIGVTRPQDGGRQRGIALHDLAGDWVQVRSECAKYTDQLSRGGGIVYLVDVTQIPEVATFVRGRLDTVADEDMQDPIASLENIAAVVRRGLDLRPDQRIEVPLAVAISKLDVLHYLVNSAQDGHGPDAALSIRQGYALTRDPYGGDVPTGLYDPSDGWWVHQEVRSLLVALGVDRLLSTVASNFANSRYFAMSALGHQPPKFGGVKGFAPFRVDEPFRWLLAEQW